MYARINPRAAVPIYTRQVERAACKHRPFDLGAWKVAAALAITPGVSSSSIYACAAKTRGGLYIHRRGCERERRRGVARECPTPREENIGRGKSVCTAGRLSCWGN